jgi:hypothetical protein
METGDGLREGGLTSTVGRTLDKGDVHRLLNNRTWSIIRSVPGFDGAEFSMSRKDPLWDRFCVAAPQRRRQSVERYIIPKRA